MIKRPEYVDRIIKYKDTPFVKILTGIRRCGKSTIMKMLMEEIRSKGIEENRIIHINFDSLEYEEIKTAKQLYEYVKERLYSGGRTYLFFDEIQEVKSWEKAVNSLMEAYDTDIYVTGSNSRMMSSEISTYLTGRYISFRIFPLSFSEYIDFRSRFTEIKDNHSELADYLRLGGFPAVHLQSYAPDEVYTVSYTHLDVYKRQDFH